MSPRVPGGQTDPQRIRALGPYLEKLRGWSAPGAAGSQAMDQVAKIRVGDRVLTLLPWERERVRDALSGSGRPIDGCAELLTQGVALLTKSLVDVDRVRRDAQPSTDSLYRMQAELMLDTAIGTALLRETQDAIDAMVFAGQVEQAKHLSEFRHKLSHTVSEIKGLLSATEQTDAEVLSDAMGPAPEAAARGPVMQDRATLGQLERRIEAQLEQTSAAAAPSREQVLDEAADIEALILPRSSTRLPTRTEVLGLLLVLVALAWVLLIKLPAELVDRPRILTSEAMARPELFQSFEARPPSLFVTLAPDSWAAMGQAERMELIRDLARFGTASGYQGILVRTAEGRPVARWLKSRGVTLIERGEEPTIP